MGEVYKATDTRTNRAVAIKWLSAELATDPQFRDRFSREARAMAEIDHPHVCKVLDSGEHEGRAYLVMRHLDGDTLATALDKRTPPFEQMLRYAIELADALAAMHRSGV